MRYYNTMHETFGNIFEFFTYMFLAIAMGVCAIIMVYIVYDLARQLFKKL
jgi:cell division protein FtsL